ncbi:MAG TPA: lyase [Methylophaga sp.]|nr:lyase [Methylophaga sp.]
MIIVKSICLNRFTTFLTVMSLSIAVQAEPRQNSLPALLEFTEWQVPWENSRPRDPYMGPDGKVWFVGQVGDYVAWLDPKTGDMKKFDIAKAGPHTVIVDKTGTPWYAGNKDQHIGKMNPQTGDVMRINMPEGVNDPHTMAFTSDGYIWFTVQRSGEAGFIGRLNMADNDVDIIEVPGKNMRPYGLVIDSQDRPWIAFMGDNAIGTVDPESMVLQIIDTPTQDSVIRRIGVTSDDRIWWTDAGMGHIGVYDPQQKSMRQWPTPGGEAAGLYAMTVDHKDRIWYVETGLQPNRFIGFDSQNEKFISIDEVPSGGISIRHMVFDEASNAIWFATDANTIGKAVVPE